MQQGDQLIRSNEPNQPNGAKVAGPGENGYAGSSSSYTAGKTKSPPADPWQTRKVDPTPLIPIAHGMGSAPRNYAPLLRQMQKRLK
jgi:hypothetical protein